jgi:hypothetical protein
MTPGDSTAASHITCPPISGYGLTFNIYSSSLVTTAGGGNIDCLYNRGGYNAARNDAICRYTTRTGE